MKKLITLSALALTMCFFSTKTFAQREAGGSSDGTTIPPEQPITFPVSIGSDLTLNFTQANANSIPVLVSIVRNGTVTNINGNLSNLSCLSFYQFFAALFTYANHNHPSGNSGCHQTSCRNPRCH